MAAKMSRTGTAEYHVTEADGIGGGLQRRMR